MHVNDDEHATGIPHVYTSIFLIILLASLATWVVPAGIYDSRLVM